MSSTGRCGKHAFSADRVSPLLSANEWFSLWEHVGRCHARKIDNCSSFALFLPFNYVYKHGA